MEEHLIAAIRDFNRFYTNVLGVVDNHYLEGKFSLTEARILYEISQCKGITARQIKNMLRIDEGYLSRILGKMAKNNLVKKIQLESDKRSFVLELTLLGRKHAADIDRQSDRQVEQLIGHLDDAERRELIEHVKKIRQLLTHLK